jgi:hypothetical protein
MRRHHAARQRQAAVLRAHVDAGAGRGRGLHAVLRAALGEGKRYKFATGVADSVSRVVALSLLGASLMFALSQSIVGVIFGGGRFTPGDVNLTCIVFCVLHDFALCLVRPGHLCARLLRGGNHLAPDAGQYDHSVVAFPLYGLGYRMWGAEGLALASDAGIVLQAVTLACSCTSAAWSRSPASTCRDGPLPLRCRCGWRGCMAPRVGDAPRTAPRGRRTRPASRSLERCRDPGCRYCRLGRHRQGHPRQGRLRAARSSDAPAKTALGTSHNIFGIGIERSCERLQAKQDWRHKRPCAGRGACGSN